MRDNLPPNAVRVENAECGCERYQFDVRDAMGGLMEGAGVVCLHVDACEHSGKAPAKAEATKAEEPVKAAPKRKAAAKKA